MLDDIYSLGATIYDLLTGTPPFYKGDIEAQIRELTAPNMSERLAELKIDDSIHPAWEKVVAACLAKDPGQRPHSASEVLRGLESASKTLAARNLKQPAWRQRILDREILPLLGKLRGLAPAAMLSTLQPVRARIGRAAEWMQNLFGNFRSFFRR